MLKQNSLRIINVFFIFILRTMIFSQINISSELTECDFNSCFEIPQNVDINTLFSVGSYRKLNKKTKLVYDKLQLDVKIFDQKILISSLKSNNNFFISSKEVFECKVIGYGEDLNYLFLFCEIFQKNCDYLISVNYLKDTGTFSITQYDNY